MGFVRRIFLHSVIMGNWVAMKALDKYFMWVATALDMIGGWLVLPAITILVMIDVVLRYVFNSPFIWTLEFSEWSLLLVFLFALPECTRVDGHVRMDLVTNLMTDRWRGIFSLAYFAVGFWIFYLLGRHEWDEFWFDYGFNRVTEFLELPVWVHSFAILTTSVLMGVLFLIRAIERLLLIISGVNPGAVEIK
jgi:TRAP-type C4-dicarboxylate transport system permease small subunit